jgi:hypothetical protein
MKKIREILVKCILDRLSRWELLLKKLGLGIGIFSAYSSRLVNLCGSGRLTKLLTHSFEFSSVRNSDATQKRVLKILKDKKTQLRKLLIDIGIFSAYSSPPIELGGSGRLKKNTLYLDAHGTTMHIINRGIVPNLNRLQEINTAKCIFFLF